MRITYYRKDDQAKLRGVFQRSTCSIFKDLDLAKLCCTRPSSAKINQEDTEQRGGAKKLDFEFSERPRSKPESAKSKPDSAKLVSDIKKEDGVNSAARPFSSNLEALSGQRKVIYFLFY